MQDELSYLTPEGFTVFTSRYLKNRGTCCKSTCLHCPYGYTLKKEGLQFREVLEQDFDLVESILRESASSSLDWKSFWPQNIHFLVVKNQIAGFMLRNHIVVKHVILKPQFQHQDLNKDMVESYYFI